MTPRKFYTFEDCPGVLWQQREMRYPQFEKIKSDFVAFLTGLSLEADLVTSLNQFIDTNLKEAVVMLVEPARPETLFGRIRQWFTIRWNDVDTADPLRYMSLSEVAEAVNDFFFLNRKWTEKLSGSAENVGGILTEVMAALTTMTTLPGPLKSSGSSPQEAPPSMNT